MELDVCENEWEIVNRTLSEWLSESVTHICLGLKLTDRTPYFILSCVKMQAWEYWFIYWDRAKLLFEVWPGF